MGQAPKTWPDHLDDTVRALNNRLLPALKHTPKELLLGLVVDTKHTIPTDSITPATDLHAAVHMVYIAQQRLDGYDEAVWHALKRKTLFDKRVLQWRLGEVVFGKENLYRSTAVTSTTHSRWSISCYPSGHNHTR